MSFFCPPCCCKGVEGRSEYSLSLPAKTAFKKYFHKISKSMSFWRLKGCGRGMRGVLAFGIGSVLAPDARRRLELAPFWRQRAKAKAGFSRVASILMPIQRSNRPGGINFDVIEKFFLRKA